MNDVIKSFLVGLGFDVDDASLAKFNKAISNASVKVLGLYAAVKVSAAGIFYSISKISEGFEDMGYQLRLVAPAVNKMLLLRQAMLQAYRAAGVDLTKVVRQSILFNFSLAKTKFALEAVYKSVGARFLPLLTKQMDVFRSKIFANMPKIQNALEKFINFIFKAFDATVQLGMRVWSILGRIWDFFKKLDDATDGWSTRILGLIAIWKFLNLSFLATPLGMLIAGFVTLLTLWDDFKTFQEGGQSLINWGSQTVKVIVGITTAIVGLGVAIGAILGVMKAWAAVQWLVNLAMAANPLGLFIIGVTALIGLLTTLAYKLGYLKSIGSFFGDLGGKVMNVLGSGGPQSSVNGPLTPAPLLPSTGGNMQKVSQETNILVQGSADANATGKAVASEQSKVNFDMTRNMRGALR